MNTINISDKSVRDNLFSIIILCVCLSDSDFTNVLERQPSKSTQFRHLSLFLGSGTWYFSHQKCIMDRLRGRGSARIKYSYVYPHLFSVG